MPFPPLALTPEAILPRDRAKAALAGRVFLPQAARPAIAAVRGDMLIDITAHFPTMSHLCETADPAAALRAADGRAIGTLAAGWDDVANPVSLEICGTEGHATIVNNELFFQSNKVKGADGKKAWTELPKGLPRPLELFIAAINGKTDVPLVTIGEAAYRCAVMDALYQGAREQKWVAPQGQAPAK